MNKTITGRQTCMPLPTFPFHKALLDAYEAVPIPAASSGRFYKCLPSNTG